MILFNAPSKATLFSSNVSFYRRLYANERPIMKRIILLKYAYY